MGNVKKVLIVDDSKSVGIKLKNIINEIDGFEVCAQAFTGKEGIKLFKSEKPDLVTMDIILPDITGLESLKKILEIDPDASVIVISSVGGSQERIFEAIKSGAKNVIVKPFTKELIKKVILHITS